MYKKVKIYDNENDSYLVCGSVPLGDGTYDVGLDIGGYQSQTIYETWALVPVTPDENVFILRMEPLGVHLISFSSDPKEFPILRAAKPDFASPVELKYSANNKTIITNAGSASLYLSSAAKDEVVYFTPDVATPWEIQYI